MRRHYVSYNFSDWDLDGLARLLWNRADKDGLRGWLQELERMAHKLEDRPGDTRYRQKFMDAEVMVLGLASEIEYRRFGELTPSGD